MSDQEEAQREPGPAAEVSSPVCLRNASVSPPEKLEVAWEGEGIFLLLLSLIPG